MKTIRILVGGIIMLALVATATGIFSNQGPGNYEFTSIHGQKVLIYGKGIYQHMSAEVAPQGIAQDVVTMVVGIPLLLLSLYLTGKGSMKGRFLLSGTLGYFLVTYLFYTTMGMYNHLFLVYVLLLSLSFYAFLLTLLSFDVTTVRTLFKDTLPVKLIGGFLMFTAVAIGLLWLNIVIPPLLKGAIPIEVSHYTTLIVQGLDLSILLPASFISGILLIKKKDYGYLLAPIYLIFLTILMTALTAKVIAMAFAGANVFPVILIIPLFNLISIICAVLVIKNSKELSPNKTQSFHFAR